MLDDLIQRNLANGLADFAGLHIEGDIPIRQELLNEILADFLSGGSSRASESAPPTTAPSPAAAAASRPKPDRAALERLLRQLVKRAEVTAENGALTLHFELRR